MTLTLLLVALIAVLFLYALVEAQQARLIRYTLPIRGLPPELDGFRILHLSDLHIAGIGRRERWLIELLSTSAPDVLAVTGDLVSSPRGVPVALEVLRHGRATHGAYFVNGNNEIEELIDLGPLHAQLKEIGIEPLVNEHRVLDLGGQQIVIAGVDDPKNRLDDLGRALDRAPRDAVPILLSHTPETFPVAARRGIPLVLSGHTHGGQVRIPLIGAIWTDTPRTGLKYSAGHYQLGDAHLIVSRGMGWSLLPIRFLCPPEVAEIVLQSAP